MRRITILAFAAATLAATGCTEPAAENSATTNVAAAENAEAVNRELANEGDAVTRTGNQAP